MEPKNKNGPPEGGPLPFQSGEVLFADVAPELEEVKQVVDVHLTIAGEVTWAWVWVITSTWVVGRRIVIQSFWSPYSPRTSKNHRPWLQQRHSSLLCRRYNRSTSS